MSLNRSDGVNRIRGWAGSDGPQRFIAKQRGVRLLTAGFLLYAVGCCLEPAAHAGGVRIIDGPIVLHGAIRQQWGGHTFGYLLEGKLGVFWSAAEYDPNEKLGQTHLIVGQYPKPGCELTPATTGIAIPSTPYPSAQLRGADAAWRVYNCNQPQMLRTPDGYLHIFFGASYLTGDDSFKPGRIRYCRRTFPVSSTARIRFRQLLTIASTRE